MNNAHGIPKGMRLVLEERGINTRNMKADDMRDILSSHPDFQNEKSMIEHFLFEEKGHIVYMLPKFHCELNPIGHKQSVMPVHTVSTVLRAAARQ